MTTQAEPTRLVQTDLSDAAWEEFVVEDTNSLVFHHPAWAQMLAECYGLKAFGLALANTDGHLVAGVPVAETRWPLRRRWISFPFTDLCPPLVGGDRVLQARLEAEIDGAKLAAGIRSVELRGPPVSGHALVEVAGFEHTLRLESDADQVYRRFRPKQVRHAIRYAERSGVTVARAERMEDLTETFYALQTATRRRLGVPVQPRRYFALLWRRIVEPGLGFGLIAHVGDRAIAGAVFLAWKRTVVYKHSASDANAWSLRPNNAVLWEAIRWACENGYSTFHLGKTDVGNDGLRTFKRGWGTDEAPLEYCVIGQAGARRSAGGHVASFARAAIRRSPPFVCRAIGRALYRYAA